jgi:hypothetical protein
MVGSAHGGRRVGRHHLADHEPIDQHANGGKLLLHARRRGLGLQRLYIGGDVVRPDSAQRQRTAVAPGEETRAAPRISAPGVGVADIGGEEFDVAPGGLVAELGDERGDSICVGLLGRKAGGRDDGGELVGGWVWGCHGPYPSTKVTHDKRRYHA